MKRILTIATVLVLVLSLGVCGAYAEEMTGGNWHVTFTSGAKMDDDLELNNLGIGTYSVDESGLLTIELTEEGKSAVEQSGSASIDFEMDATAQDREGGGDSDFNFGGAGQDFDFKVMDQPRASVEKTSRFTENEDKKGGVLDYTVKTTVEHGDINDVVVKDVLTPPQTDAFDLEQVMAADGKTPAVTVTVTMKDAEGKETTVTLGPGDYDLEVLPGDPNNPLDKAFQVMLKGEKYNPLKEGSVLNVTYQYNVQYMEGATDIFWGNVENVANVTGHMPVDNPEEPGTKVDSQLDETRSSSVELYVAPPGHGVVSKDQAFSEATHTLHYTLYTVVPAGKWTPLYIFDDMVVNYNGKNYYLQEFKDGRVKDLKVKAVDVPDWFSWGDDDGNLSAEELQKLKELKAGATEVMTFDYYDDLEAAGYKFYDPESTDPMNVDQCVTRYGKQNLYIIFGLAEGENDDDDYFGKWGHWNYGTDRLIITEYDLDMSDLTEEDTLTLSPMDGKGGELTLSPDAVLRAGITNNVYLRFGSYYPGYKVFFNNTEQMNKTGGLRKEDGNVYIDYTVTMNATDSTVNKYFCDVNADMWAAVEKVDKNWNAKVYYPLTMQAVFYDVLPEGWEYVKGSLSVTTFNNGKTQTFFYPEDNTSIPAMLTEDGRVINAPLVLFRDDVSGDRNHELFNALSDTLVSLTFKYTLQASEEWLEKQAGLDAAATVLNHAEIKDEKMTHWKADATNDYIPDRLTKTAKRVGSEFGNLLEFTLDVNPGNKKFIQPGQEAPQSYLLVTDESTNLEVQTTSIVVADAGTGEALTYAGAVDLSQVEYNDNWPADQWGTVPSEEGQFRLVVPNGRHLTVTYNALITQKGDSVRVSNKASIDGISRSNSGFDESLKVDQMDGGGSARTYGLYVQKEDATNGRALADAQFEFYLVRKEDSKLDQTAEIKVGDKTYSCYSGDDWKITTDDKGGFSITAKMEWMLEPGNYYILRETKAPNGYLELKEPVLFYYGYEDTPDMPAVAVRVLPGTTLTVYNTPIQSLRVVKKGSAGEKPFPLEGAQFELCEAVKNAGGTYSPAGSGESYSGVSQNGDGYVVWGDGKTELHLSPNSYYILRETAAPEGYVQVEGDIVLYAAKDGKLTVVSDPLPEGVTVPAEPADGPVFELTVVDPSSYVLPESGGVGTTWLYGLGTTLILTAAMVLVCDSRRRRTRS